MKSMKIEVGDYKLPVYLVSNDEDVQVAVVLYSDIADVAMGLDKSGRSMYNIGISVWKELESVLAQIGLTPVLLHYGDLFDMAQSFMLSVRVIIVIDSGTARVAKDRNGFLASDQTKLLHYLQTRAFGED